MNLLPRRDASDSLRTLPLLAVVLTGGLLSGGCQQVTDAVMPAPTPEPTPTFVPTPKPDLFDPKDGVTEDPATVVPLNKPDDPKSPIKFRVTQVDSGDLLRLQTVTMVKSGNPPQDVKAYGVPDVMRLAGILVPQPGQPGWADTVKQVNRWVLNQEVDVQQDARFPEDLSHRRIVQIFFNRLEGRPEEKGQRVLLNRMLVRMGYAWVDLNSPTKIDVKPWLNDEQFARNHRLGLWGKGIVFAGRIPVPAPKGSKLKVQRVDVKNTKVTTTVKRGKSSITTSTTAPTKSSSAPMSSAPPSSAPPSSAPPSSSPPSSAPPSSAPPSSSPPSSSPPSSP